jgi:hypothetical protein
MAKKYLFEYLDTRKCKVVTSYTQLSKLSGLSPWIISQQFKDKNCYYDRDGKFRITVTEVETDIAKMRKSKL